MESNRRQPKSRGWRHSLTPKFLRGFTGWRAGVLLWASVAAAVCSLNIALTVWASTKNHVDDGVSYLYTGSCTKTARMSFWLHIGINVLSTLLLSARNCKVYSPTLSRTLALRPVDTMQAISSPTRNEVDNAHRDSRWLDIGVPGIRNLRFIKRGRVFWWSLLAISSIPLHLLYVLFP